MRFPLRADVPLRRLDEIRRRNPRFVSQKDGWNACYSGQWRFNRVLALRERLGLL